MHEARRAGRCGPRALRIHGAERCSSSGAHAGSGAVPGSCTMQDLVVAGVANVLFGQEFVSRADRGTARRPHRSTTSTDGRSALTAQAAKRRPGSPGRNDSSTMWGSWEPVLDNQEGPPNRWGAARSGLILCRATPQRARRPREDEPAPRQVITGLFGVDGRGESLALARACRPAVRFAGREYRDPGRS